jgi:drug/metabolite transporter (DMT)-like permease
VANIAFLPLLWIEGSPGFLPARLIPYVILMGAMEFGYYWLYYEALKHEDTSIVSSLFSIGKVFIPLGAFFILSERLLP